MESIEKFGVTEESFNSYLHYLNLRDQVTDLRIQGLESTDPYFKSFPSCQNRRYMDRESQYFIENITSYTGKKPISNALLHLIFRKNSTYIVLKQEFNDPATVNPVELTEFILNNVEVPFTGAYLVPHRDKHFDTKVAGWLDLFNLYDFEQIQTMPTAETVFKFFKSIPGFGDFIAMQFATELSWMNETKYGGNEFVIPGNGAVRGLNKLGVSKKEHISFLKYLVKLQPIQSTSWLPMTLMDYQNTFCEFDKFTRLTGDYDNQGRNRQKRKRRPHQIPITKFKVTEKLQSASYHLIH
jgi:hypothetical protein